MDPTPKPISQLPAHTGSPSGFQVPGVTNDETRRADLGQMINRATAPTIGNLSDLQTQAKNNLVAAINEAAANVSDLSAQVGDVEKLVNGQQPESIIAFANMVSGCRILNSNNGLLKRSSTQGNLYEYILAPNKRYLLNVEYGSTQALPYALSEDSVTTPSWSLETTIPVGKYALPEGEGVVGKTEETTYEILTGYGRFSYLIVFSHKSHREPILKECDYVDSISGRLDNVTSSSFDSSGIRKSSPLVQPDSFFAVDEYPNHSKSYGETAVCSFKFTTFDGVVIGKSMNAFNTDGKKGYSRWFEIDATSVKYFVNAVLDSTIPHGITSFFGFLTVSIVVNSDDISINLITGSGESFSHTIRKTLSDDIVGPWKLLNKSASNALTDCTFSVNNSQLKSKFWIFGASFESLGGITRWPYYLLREYGVSLDKLYFNGYPGRDSFKGFKELKRALAIARPQYIYWTMWGNDNGGDLGYFVGAVKCLCDRYGVTLIIISRPSSISSTELPQYEYKKASADYFASHGVRVVRAYDALSADRDDPNAIYPGFLDPNDNKHTSAIGALSLAKQVALDVPEILQYK